LGEGTLMSIDPSPRDRQPGQVSAGGLLRRAVARVIDAVVVGVVGVALGLALAASACTGQKPGGDRMLDVMTFNLRYDTPSDSANAWPHRRDWVAALIRFHGADAIGVQEALVHGGIANDVGVDIEWLASEDFESERGAAEGLGLSQMNLYLVWPNARLGPWMGKEGSGACSRK
jgi:hypothetical protein